MARGYCFSFRPFYHIGFQVKNIYHPFRPAGPPPAGGAAFYILDITIYFGILLYSMYFLDLFSGIGGFALGAYWAGLRFDGHYFSEVDDYAIRVYRRRFPDAVGLGDIRNIRGSDLPAGDWIVAGGFPCQDISVAGKGLGLAGARSGLWFEYARLIGELRPRYAIMENVGALTGRGLDAVLGSLAEIGYDAEWQDIRASDVGAPHERRRTWVIAYPNGSRFSDTCRKPAAKKITQIRTSARMDSRPDFAQDAKTWSEAESRMGRVVNGLPDTVDRIKCLGNSIVPQIAELIFRQISEDLCL